jgi:hypothetical protein
MADNTPNEKDIRSAQERLAEYNDSLRESISLSRVLSDNIQTFAKRLGGVNVEDRKLIDGTKEIGRALTNTLKLSDKLYAGKLKQIDIDKQLETLARLKNEYAKEEQNENSKINQAKSLQSKLQEDVKKLEDEGIAIRARYTERLEDQLDLTQQLERATEAYNNANNTTQKDFAKAQQESLRERIKDNNISINTIEKTQSLNEKNLIQKKKEKEETDKIVDFYRELLKLIEEQILKNEALSGALKEQNSSAKKFKDEIEGIGKRIKDNIHNTLSLTTIFTYLKKVALEVSDQVTRLQKNLVLSREEAYTVRQEFNRMAVESGNVALNTNRLVEANAKLGEQLGFSSKFTDDLNSQFVLLTKQIGLSEEAAGGLAKLSIASGKTLKESKNIAFETTQNLSSQYGIQLNQKEVLEEVGKISGQTLAMFKGSVPALTQAVAQAKLLGTTLDNTRKQASALLDFETSIENELQAELLTGQQLNLERARTAALMGDMTTVMKELNNQNIDFNKFSNMNVIAQDKIAAALGTTSDTLSDQLLKQQYLNKSTEEVRALAGDEVAKRLEAINAQDRFNLAMEKMQDIVARLVGGPLGTMADIIASIASNTGVLYGVLTAIAGLSLARTVSSIALMSAQLRVAAIAGAATSAFLNPVNLILGVAALATAVGVIASAMNNAEDATEFANGGLVYGKTNAIVGEYSGAANNPEVIAPLSDLQDIISNSNRQTAAAQDNSEMIKLFTDMRNELRATRENTGKFVNKKLVAGVDIQQVGTAQMMFGTNLP